ncbi:MAG: rhodanese-like domain-containing protein [Planctomycetota bacterium]
MAQHPILKIVSLTGCQSYLVGCPDTRQALLIDPKVGLEGQYRQLLAAYGLHLVAIVDTHTHADHLSAAPNFAGPGVTVFMGRKTTVDRDVQRVGAGDRIAVGHLVFEVLDVPGHTPDSIALLWRGTQHPSAVFTGDTLLLGGLARADFRGSDPVLLWDSVQHQLMSLPDDTLVFPGHSYDQVLFGTIGHERETNAALAFASARAYAEDLGALEGSGNSKEVDEVLALNVTRNPKLPEKSSPVAACCAATHAGGGGGYSTTVIAEVAGDQLPEVHAGLEGPHQWVDVRDPHEVRAERIPGVTHIALGELGFYLDHFRDQGRVYVSCRSGMRSLAAIRTLMRLGVCENPVNVAGGFLAWQDLGLPVENESLG